MKRLKGIVLLVAMLLMFTGCGKEDPKALYQKATEKAANTSSLDTTMKISVKGSAEGEDLAYDLGIQMQLENKTKDMKNARDLKMKMVMTLPEELGAMMGSEMAMYYAGGYFYMDIMGQKFKTPMDFEKLEEQMGTSVGSASGMMEISADSLSSLSSSKDGENTKLSYTINKDKMDNALNSALESYRDLLGQGSDITFSDVKGEMVVNKDSDILSQKLEMDCAVATDGTNGTMHFIVNYTNNKPGETVTVELPDFSDYTEVDSSLLN